jgi:hypothetical protein
MLIRKYILDPDPYRVLTVQPLGAGYVAERKPFKIKFSTYLYKNWPVLETQQVFADNLIVRTNVLLTNKLHPCLTGLLKNCLYFGSTTGGGGDIVFLLLVWFYF